jgi:hypothetical protein
MRGRPVEVEGVLESKRGRPQLRATKVTFG